MSQKLPLHTKADTVKILAEFYALNALNVEELVSSESRNFFIDAVPQVAPSPSFSWSTSSTTLLTETRSRTLSLPGPPRQYVLKILSKNLCISSVVTTTRKQLACSQFLRQKGFLCARIIPSNNGELLTRISEYSYVVLMARLPGKDLSNFRSQITNKVLFELGALLASFHQTLQGCDEEYLDPDPTNPRCLENSHLVAQYLDCTDDNEDYHAIIETVTNFKQIRENLLPEVKKGIIHGDLHDYNLIVDWVEPDEQLDTVTSSSPATSLCSSIKEIRLKYGIIDFKDMNYSYPVLDLCKLIGNMASVCCVVDLLDTGGHVLAGYASQDIQLVRQFRAGFFDTVLMLLAQCIVMDEHEYRVQEQTNVHCLVDVENYKCAFRGMKTVGLSGVYSAWSRVLKLYGIEDALQSMKSVSSHLH